MEDRCIVCGDVIPEGRQICLKCESITEEEAVEKLGWYSSTNGCGWCTDAEHRRAKRLGVRALKAQIKLKEYIERINQPEYNEVVWKKDEVVMLLQELLADRS